MYRLLTNCSFFKGFDENQIKGILESTHYNISHFNKNTNINSSGDDVNYLMIIIKGVVRTEMLDASGKTFRMEDIFTSQLIAPGFLYGAYAKFPVNVVSNCDTSILYIPKKSFENLLALHPKLMVNYMDIISTKTQFLAKKIKNIFLQPIEGKIATYLISQMEAKNSLNFEMDQSQTWMAERFNVARPSVARVFSALKQKGIIEVKGKTVTIIDEEYLRNCIN